jgi:hypothetical protein
MFISLMPAEYMTTPATDGQRLYDRRGCGKGQMDGKEQIFDDRGSKDGLKKESLQQTVWTDVERSRIAA